ncbi:MAG TPA: hypothetical protein VMF89_06215 [Polyangiales bacterium]|nr:hypothetical protein [Polyangiales bacterium]
MACSRPASLELKDTEGRRFELSCDQRAERCSLKPQGVMLNRNGWLLGVCEATPEGDVTHAADCRALVCKGDSDCPAPLGAATGSCIGGHCVDPSRTLSSADAVMLCMARTGPGHSKPEQIERYALGLNCGSPCVVPAPCK